MQSDSPARTVRSTDGSSPRPPSSDPVAAPVSQAPVLSDDNSGLHDIRALAETTKQRISRRAITAPPVPDELTISSSGLRAVALPEPALTVALPAPVPAAPPAPVKPRVTRLD